MDTFKEIIDSKVENLYYTYDRDFLFNSNKNLAQLNWIAPVKSMDGD